MIDIHSHILPAIDDGAADMAEALAILRAAEEAGVAAIAATPHIYNPFRQGVGEEIEAAVGALRSRAAEEGIGVEVFSGGELPMGPGLVDVVAQNRQITLGGAGKYVLVEFPMFQMPRFAEAMVSEMRGRGLTPVIAHPTRCREVMSNPGLVRGLVERGALMQINTGSLLGMFGGDSQKAAFFLLEEGLAHVVASDSHSVGAMGMLVEGVGVIRKVLGSEAARRMAETLPAAMIGFDGRKR